MLNIGWIDVNWCKYWVFRNPHRSGVVTECICFKWCFVGLSHQPLGHGGKWEDKHKCGLLGFWAVSNIQQDWGLFFFGSQVETSKSEVGLAEFPTILMVCGFVCQGFLGGPSKIAFQLRLDVNLGISKTWIYSDSFIIHIDSQGWFFCLRLPMLMLLVSSPGLRKKSLPGCWSFPCCVAMTLGYFGVPVRSWKMLG